MRVHGCVYLCMYMYMYNVLKFEKDLIQKFIQNPVIKMHRHFLF